MAARRNRLLARARASKADWTRIDLDTLYRAFGFEITPGSKHDIVKHHRYPYMRATLTRSNPLAKGYVAVAVNMIDQVIALEKEEEK